MTEKNSKLFVGNLSSKVQKEDLQKLFEEYGKISEIKIKDKGSSNIFAFIEFDDLRDAEQALTKLDTTSFMGRELRIEFGNGGNQKRKDVYCNHCQSSTHDQRDCRKMLGAKRCYTCGSTRHISRDCDRSGRRRSYSRDRDRTRRRRSSRSISSRSYSREIEVDLEVQHLERKAEKIKKERNIPPSLQFMGDPASKQFLSKKVNPILEKLVIELVVKKPANITEFMIKWLQEKGEQQAKYNQEHEEQSEEDEDEEGEDMMDVSKLKAINQEKQMRTSVSAEAYGKFNAKKDFKAKVIPKNPEQVQRIKSRLQQAFMFQSLDEQEQKIVIDAMEEKNFEKGSTVIKQGEDGNHLYVIDKGTLDCFRKMSKDAKQDTKLKEYQPGEAFGELALLYNAPRAATIIANSDCILFSLDRDTFNHIVKDAASKKREKYETFLSKVDILHDMSQYERMQIADALKTQKFKKGDYIVKEGDYGDVFYILEEGDCIATKIIEAGKEPVQVYKYKQGEYFGEIALLKNATRAASVIATSDGQAVYMDRNTFKRLLGPLEDILRRNFSKYEKYMQ